MFWHNRELADFSEEIKAHLELETERLKERGLSEAEARAAARRTFGNVTQAQERFYESGRWLWWDHLVQDVRFGLRQLRRNPGFTAVAVLTLALGIGLNSAIFSAINAVLLRPLPYKDPERLVNVEETLKSYQNGGAPVGLSPANYLDFEKQNQVFEVMAAVNFFFGNYGRLALVTGDQTERVQGVRVSASFFPVLGVQPMLGRTFLPEEDKPGAKVVVLSYELWRQRFGADQKVLGRDIRLDEARYRVIGVMPEGFRYFGPTLYSTDLWLPYPFENIPSTTRFGAWFRSIARLKPGVSLEQARAEMQVIARRLEKEYPKENKGMGAWVGPLQEVLTGDSRSTLLPLWGAVGLVLLIACANVANLLLARAGSRKREIAVRTAVGAGRARLVRQLLTESILLALAGGAAGLILAFWSADLLNGLLPRKMSRLDEASVDLRVLGLALVVSLLTGILFGLAPALQGSKVDLNDALKDAGRSSSEGRAGMRLRGALVVVQVGLSLVLLAGAGLMVNSLWRLYRLRLGFNPDHVLTLRCWLPTTPPYVAPLGIRETAPSPGVSFRQESWALSPQAIRFPEQVVETLKKLPGVESVAASVYGLPMRRSIGSRFRIEGQPAPSPEQAERMGGWGWAVTPDYFRTMGIRLVEGRAFNEGDTQNAPGVVIINQSLARTIWPSEPSAIGKRIILDYLNRPFQIIGVANDVRAWPRERVAGQIYIPLTQCWRPSYAGMEMPLRLEHWFVVRTRSNPKALAAAVSKAIHEEDKGQPVDEIHTYEEVISEQFGPWRKTMLLLGLFAGLALLLSAVGIYGVVSYAVTQRTHEIGVRVALGASPGEALWLVMRSGLRFAVLGVAVGAGAAHWLTRLISSQLYGVAPTDPLTFASVAAVLLIVAMLACYIPARRATKVDPMVALRYE